MPEADEQPINEFASVRLDGSGNGAVSIGPKVAREYWRLSQASVSVSSTTAESACKLFFGGTAAVPGRYLGGSSTGSTGDTYGNPPLLQPGATLLAVWTGGTPNATATLTVNGFKGRYGR